MEEFEHSIQIERIKAVINRLVEIGWISQSVLDTHVGTCDIVWTEKGKQCGNQFKEIVTELRGGPEDLLALAVICRSHLP